MRIIIARDDASIARNIENEKSRFNSYAGAATAELADRLGKARVEHNWVSPAIIASHVLTGNDAALKQVSQIVGQQANPGNYLLMHAMGPNVAGVIGTAVAAGTMLAMLK